MAVDADEVLINSGEVNQKPLIVQTLVVGSKGEKASNELIWKEESKDDATLNTKDGLFLTDISSEKAVMEDLNKYRKIEEVAQV